MASTPTYFAYKKDFVVGSGMWFTAYYSTVALTESNKPAGTTLLGMDAISDNGNDTPYEYLFARLQLLHTADPDLTNLDMSKCSLLPFTPTPPPVG